MKPEGVAAIIALILVVIVLIMAFTHQIPTLGGGS